MRVGFFEQEWFGCDVELFAAAREENPSFAESEAFAPACWLSKRKVTNDDMLFLLYRFV